MKTSFLWVLAACLACLVACGPKKEVYPPKATAQGAPAAGGATAAAGGEEEYPLPEDVGGESGGAGGQAPAGAVADDAMPILPAGLDVRPGGDLEVKFGRSTRDSLLDTFGMPGQMKEQGDGSRFVYANNPERFPGFSRVDIIFSEEGRAQQVELYPYEAITKARVTAQFGAEHGNQKAANGTEIWIYKKLGLVFFFYPNSDKVSSIRLKQHI